jgi:hypothetical protein
MQIKLKDKILKVKEISYGFSNVKSFKRLYFGDLWSVKEFVKYLLNLFKLARERSLIMLIYLKKLLNFRIVV